jgi:futalosine hydrolase
MHVLLVSATEFEISEMTAWLNSRVVAHNDSNPEWLISGIGQLQTAFSLQRKIQVKRPALVIQAGIAGSFSADVMEKVFAVQSEEIADLGVLESTGFRNIFEMGLDQPDRFPFRKGKLFNPYHALIEFTGLPVSDGKTVNEIKSADFIFAQRNQPPFVESMEGAALHYVCLMENIPFIQIRAVSNQLGERDKSRWKLKESIGALHRSLVSMIQKLETADETLFRI